MNPLTQSKNTTILPVLVVLTLACFALSPMARAVVPAPDGGYPYGNTAEGDNALFNLTGGSDNTANGFDALYFNDAGSDNTATGYAALTYNTSGNDNTATGFDALYHNTTGNHNTAVGSEALFFETSGHDNTATGFQALLNNTTGNNNTADGVNALLVNTTGMQNTATGVGVLRNNTTANNNTADGFQALFHNITGGGNTAIGVHALLNNKGSSNIGLGLNAGVNLTIGSNNIDIGAPGAAGESARIRIGVQGTQTATNIAGIVDSPISGTGVVVNSFGRLGVASSSVRFKHEIKPMEKASEAIFALKPVTFRYKEEIDPDRVPQFGLVAEDVEKINPNLVVRDAAGKPYTVRYDAVNAMLLNEFLKEHRKVEKLAAMVAQQQRDFEAAVAELKGQIQKVSAQLELNKDAPQTVLNDL